MFLGRSFKQIREYKRYFNEDYAYLICPSYEDYEYIKSREITEENEVVIFGKEIIDVENLKYEVFFSTYLENGEMLILDQNIEVYTTEKILDKTQIYQTQNGFEFAKEEKLSFKTLPFLEDKMPNFLFIRKL
ncbi:MAG: hypothetical protein NC310_05145 [Roseburia sp.]|nr:hypothetical protein [Anaeroplasma bactoclasticum]MCM1196445.1 hypothetical protein [Roseburia sp.]